MRFAGDVVGRSRHVTKKRYASSIQLPAALSLTLSKMMRQADVWRSCNKIRAAVFRTGVDLRQWLQPLDPRRTGLLSDSQFVSVLAGPLRAAVVLSADEIAQLADYFRAADGRVLYRQLCELIHGKNEHEPTVEGEAAARAECPGPARPPAPLDDGQRRRLCSLLATIADRDIPLKPYFQDYELVAKNDGRVTFAHFARLLAHVGIVVPVEDFHLLVRRFAADSYSVDYVQFLEAIEEARRHGLKGLGPEYRNPRAVLDTTLPKTKRPEVESGASTASLGGSEIFHPAINRPPPFERPIIDIMLRVQQFVAQQRIRFSEFFRDYDPLNSGRIPPLSFRRGLDLTGLAAILSEHEIACLIRHYLDPNDPERVCWRTFEDDCDQVFTVKELEKHPDLVAGAAVKAALASVPAHGSAEERGGPSEEELDNCERALLRLRGAVRERSVDLRSAFRDHDLHNNGHVSRSHLRRVLARLAVLPTTAQVCALEVRYLDHCGFNYVKLLEELDAKPPESSVFLQMPPTTQTGRSEKNRYAIQTDIVQILAKIKGKMISEGVRPRDFLSQFDLYRESVIPRADFYRGLATAGVSLTPLEMDTLMDVFASPRRRRFVDYSRFCDTLEEVFTQRGLERAPLLEPLKPLAVLDTPFNFLNFDERQTVSLALAKLAKYPDQVSNILEAFRSFDVANCGTVPRVSAERVLDQRRLLYMLSPRERETLYTCFGYRRGCGTELNYRALCDALDVLYAIGTQSPC